MSTPSRTPRGSAEVVAIVRRSIVGVRAVSSAVGVIVRGRKVNRPMSGSFFSQFKLSRRSRGAKRKVNRRRSHATALGRASLGLEQLEARMMLTSNPVFTTVPNEFVGEGFHLVPFVASSRSMRK